MTSANNQLGMFAAGTVAVVLLVGCATQRQLSEIQPGMTMAEVKERFGGPDQTFAISPDDSGPVEVSWYYNAYRSQEIFEWQTIPTTRPPGWRIEPGQTTVGVRYRRYEIVFHDGEVVGQAEFQPPPA